MLADAARTVATLRDEGHVVLLHCVAAQSRTPTVAIAYAMLRGVDRDRGARGGLCRAAGRPAERRVPGCAETPRSVGDSGLNDHVSTPEPEGDRPFSVVDVGMLILEAVAVLHERGHQRLRVFPGMSPSGIHWRTAITTGDNFVDNGHLHLQDFEAAFHYTTGTEFEVAGRRVDAETTAAELAESIVPLLPDPGIGIDAEYVAWYGELLDLVAPPPRSADRYADYFDDDRGWEIGWGSGIRIQAPPTSHRASDRAGKQAGDMIELVEPVDLEVAASQCPTACQPNTHVQSVAFELMLENLFLGELLQEMWFARGQVRIRGSALPG